jgi:ParB-like chromosome segregation protein Spo0J
MSEVKEFPLEKVEISSLTFDPENPNELNEEQEKGLRKSFQTFGNLYPILIDQNNLIVHGNHRAKIYQDMGLKTIPAFRREFKDDNERRICSQSMNKLHGNYEPIKDSSQLLKIMQGGRLGELAELIAQPKESLERLINNERNDELNKLLNSGGSMEYLTVEFTFDNEYREDVEHWLAMFKQHFKCKTNGEVFIRLCQEVESKNADILKTNQ